MHAHYPMSSNYLSPRIPPHPVGQQTYMVTSNRVAVADMRGDVDYGAAVADSGAVANLGVLAESRFELHIALRHHDLV